MQVSKSQMDLLFETTAEEPFAGPCGTSKKELAFSQRPARSLCRGASMHQESCALDRRRRIVPESMRTICEWTGVVIYE